MAAPGTAPGASPRSRRCGLPKPAPEVSTPSAGALRSVTVWLHCPLLACSPRPSATPACCEQPRIGLTGVPHGPQLCHLPPLKMEARNKSRKNPHLVLTLQEMYPWEFFKSSYESAVVRKWDVFGQQLHCAPVRAEAALCGCIILNIVRNQALIYCCLQA